MTMHCHDRYFGLLLPQLADELRKLKQEQERKPRLRRI